MSISGRTLQLPFHGGFKQDRQKHVMNYQAIEDWAGQTANRIPVSPGFLQFAGITTIVCNDLMQPLNIADEAGAGYADEDLFTIGDTTVTVEQDGLYTFSYTVIWPISPGGTYIGADAIVTNVYPDGLNIGGIGYTQTLAVSVAQTVLSSTFQIALYAGGTYEVSTRKDAGADASVYLWTSGAKISDIS